MKRHKIKRCLKKHFFCTLYYPFRKIRVALTGQGYSSSKSSANPVLQVHAGFFRVSVIHRTLTWTTGSFTSARDHSYVCVSIHTGGLGTPRTSQHNIFDSKKRTTFFLVLLTGLEPRVFGSGVGRSIN